MLMCYMNLLGKLIIEKAPFVTVLRNYAFLILLYILISLIKA
jgi:hypothetical protein